MKLKDVIDRIRFNTSTQSQLSGKGIGDLFSNKNIMQQLKFALDKYATFTQGIEDIYSISLATTIDNLDAPPLALRSRAYRLCIVWIDGVKYLLDSPRLSVDESVFDYQPLTGVPFCFVPWSDQITVHPTASSSFQTTTLNGALTAASTTITLTDGSLFLTNKGRITIGDEKISYNLRSGNVLSGLTRGAEQTAAAAHLTAATVDENNLWFYYYRLHTLFAVTDRDFITQDQLDSEMDIADEHIEVITDYVAYKLLMRIPGSNAKAYKVNFEEWLTKARYAINRGRTDISRTGTIKTPELWESEIPFPYL